MSDDFRGRRADVACALEEQIDSLDKVEWAILEKGGQISFIEKS